MSDNETWAPVKHAGIREAAAAFERRSAMGEAGGSLFTSMSVTCCPDFLILKDYGPWR